MKVVTTKITGLDLMQKACSFTIDKESKANLFDMYRCEHSPIRTQIFCVEMYDISTFVSVHLVRHNVGVIHFVKSNRDDRCGDGTEDRNTPVNHMMLVNAQALINMSRKRLCFKAHKKTIEAWNLVKKSIKDIDLNLHAHMVKECIYRNGCYEKNSCGFYENIENFKKVVASNPEYNKIYYKKDNQVLSQDPETGKIDILKNDDTIKIPFNGDFIEITAGDLIK